MIRSSYLVLFFFALLNAYTCIAQQSFNKDVRTKISEKRLQLSTKFEYQQFKGIPYNYAIDSYYVLSSIEQELLAIIQEDFEVFKSIFILNAI